MDAITRVSYYFPTHTLTIFSILANLVINDSASCEKQQQSLMIAMLVLFAIACFFLSFTDTYKGLNGQSYWVLIMPFYGPLCFSLPTDEDKDRVYDYFYLKIRDYVHATLATACFVLIMLFTNPMCMCLFPSGKNDGTSRFDAAIVRTVPIVVALLIGTMMVCLGPPRQMLGFQNVPDTIPANDRQLQNNPMYASSQPDQYPPPIPEGDEDYESGMNVQRKSASGGGAGEGAPHMGVKGTMGRSGGGMGPPRESYQSEYRQSMAQPQRQSQRQFQSMGPKGGSEYGPSEGGYTSGGGYRGEQ